MIKYFLALISVLISTNLFANSIIHPDKMPTGADFSHFSCRVFSEDSVENDSLLEGHHITFKEFGHGLFNEGSFNLKYGKSQKCEFLAKFVMLSNTNQAKILSSSFTRNPACRPGAQVIKNLIKNGFIFRQSLRNHARFSIQLISMNSSYCDNGPVYLEFLKTR